MQLPSLSCAVVFCSTLGFALSIVPAIVLCTLPKAIAQSIIAAPDGTGTNVTIDGNTYNISGGTQAGANLFHSFQEFGLSSGAIANFLSNPSISNIFGRVVGDNTSIIDGLIQTNPNLYLMNPAGIVFGANASLNVGGDFFATTADRIGFENGWFNATGANDYAALVGMPNQFAFLSGQPGAILNFGDLTTEQNVSFMGGAVLNQGQVISSQGNVTLAAIPGERLVRISEPGMLLSLEIPTEQVAAGILPVDLPTLLTGSGRGNPPVVAPNLARVSTGALPLQGDVSITGAISGQQVDFYSAGQVTPTDADLIEGDTRVIRFSETGENPDQALFIDARTDNSADLLYGAEAGTVSQIIEREDNGIAVISEQLGAIADSVGELESVAIVAEGNQGNFWLGKQWIRAENIADYATQLQVWGAALTESADLLLYSCFTALGATGEALVNSIANLTGADVAASVNATGSANYDGDWSLEASTGTIEAENPFTPGTLANWEGKLANRTVTTTDDLSSTNSLRNAIEGGSGTYASAAGTGDRIEFNIVGSPTINLSGEIAWSVDDLTIDGSNSGGDDVVVDGGNNGRVFNISGNNTTIQNLTIQNGSTTGKGGGIYLSNGSITLIDSTISSNSTRLAGGGIHSQSGDINLTRSTVSGNSITAVVVSYGYGAGISARDGNVTLTNSTVSNNSTIRGSGAGIRNANGNITLDNSVVSGNVIRTSGYGGGIAGQNVYLINSSTVSYNSVPNGGGGIWAGGIVTIDNSDVSHNYGRYSTGGISGSSGAISVINGSSVSYNEGGYAGGAGGISSSGAITVSNSMVSGNTHSIYGGINGYADIDVTNSTVSNNSGTGIRGNSGNITLLNSTVSGNSSFEGGGISGSDVNLTLTDSTISGNTATNGGGIYVKPFSGSSTVTITDSTITNNTATGGRGGGMYLSDVVLDITGTDITNNSANTAGGGIWLNNSQATLTNSPVTGNQAASSDQGDGVYLSQSPIALQSDGDLELTDSIAASDGAGSTVSLTGQNVVISVPIQSNGADIEIDAQENVQALTADATISSAGTTSGNIRIIAGNDVQLRNVLAFGTNGDGGDISITSTGGLATTTFGGSEGVLNSSGNNGDAGDVTVSASATLTLGKIFAEGVGGTGGTVELDAGDLVQITGTGTGGFGTTTSISTAGSTAGGTITIRHGGLGLTPFVVGDASTNGTAGSLSTGTGTGQTVSPTQSFLDSFNEGGIQILTGQLPASNAGTADLVVPGSEAALFSLLDAQPQALEFYGERPEVLFLKLIAEQVGGELTIDEARGTDTFREDTDVLIFNAVINILDEDNQVTFELGSDAPNPDTLINPSTGLDISAIDELLENEYVEDEVGKAVTLASIRETFSTIEQQTGTRPALIYAFSTPDALELILVTPQDNEPLIHKVIPEGDRATLRRSIRTFRRRLTSVRTGYLAPAQQLYDWLIRPIESTIENLNVDTLIFAMGEGLRAVPLAALHDGDRFLIEKYSLGQIPSMSLTDSSYEPLQNAHVLAMGASQFDQLTPLPAVPSELDVVTTVKSGERYLNEAFTLENLKTQSRDRNFDIVHLATHAAFRPGAAENAYIQLWGNEQIDVNRLRELRWFEDPQVELLVLSACETAFGDPHAELGFAGVAVQAGVKSTLASLWQISDLGTMRLMSEFYEQLNNPDVTIKAEALRQAQLALLRGEATAQNGSLEGISLPPELAQYANTDLTHPYYWSAFTLVGSPW